MQILNLIITGLVFWGFLIVPNPVSADSMTKVMINIVEDGRDRQKDALIKDSEIRIGRELIKNDIDVVLSDDLSAVSILKQADIDQARRGSVSEMRKAAAVKGAAYILSGKANTAIGQEDVLDMVMNKAVTSFSYRIINAASGKTLEMDSISVISTSRSAEAAVNSTYEKLSADLAARLMKKIPRTLSKADAKQLQTFKVSLAPEKTRQAPKPPEPPKSLPASSAPVAAPAVAQTTDSAKKDTAPEALQTAVAKLEKKNDGPDIVILNPPPSRGFKMVIPDKKINIEGLALDPAGILEVRINGGVVPHKSDGRFSQSMDLKPGENRFLVMAVNTAGQMATKDLSLQSHKDDTPPEIMILRPDVHRGFQMVMKPKQTRVTVEGIIKDNDQILFSRINGTDLTLGKNGHFIHDIEIADTGKKIEIQAADISGNITKKTFQVARGDNAWAEIPHEPAGRSKRSDIKPVLWGLAIGVSRYSSSAINLQYADQDALKLEKMFTDQAGRSFSEVHFKTLVNEQVTRNSIIESITRHLGKAAPDDIIFLFLAGHGIKHRQSGSYYYMPADSDFDNILSNGLRMSDFDESVKILSRNVNKIVVAMDTCHSGALEIGVRSGGTTEDLAEAISSASGLYVLSASKAGEVSVESDKFRLDKDFTGHGVFTYTLVEAMQGLADYDSDGYVSLNEIFQFVSRQVPRLTEGKQHPYFRMQGTDLPFIKIQ